MSVAALKLPATTTFKIQSAGSGQFVTIQGGNVILSPGGSVFVYDPSNLSVKDTGSGQYIGLDSGNIVASSTPVGWVIIENGDGTYGFQSALTGLFANAAPGGVNIASAKSLSSNQNFTFVTV